MFPNQKLNDAGNARSLQEMPNFDMDLLIRDAFNTIMYQLFLVMHNWENASMFDNVVSGNFESLVDMVVNYHQT